jgi:putative endopeptidase
MRRQLVALTFATMPLAVFAAAHEAGGVAQPFTAASTAQTAKPSASGVDLEFLDRQTDACTDFYQYACGGWIAGHPVPADRQSFTRVAELQQQNLTILRTILEMPAADGDRKKAADYYAACMDEPKVDAAGLATVTPDLNTIAELVNPDDLPVLVAHLHAIGVPVFFRFAAQTDRSDATQQIAQVDQGGLALPDRDYYLKTDERSAAIRTKYLAHITQLFTLAGTAPEVAATDAAAALAVETTLANASLDRVARRDPNTTTHVMTLAELQKMSPNFNWRKYAMAAGAPQFQIVNVSVPENVRAVHEMIGRTPMPELQAYMRWHLLHASADLLPKPFADAHFDFFNRTLTGQEAPPPRWRKCVVETDAQLGEALGKAFVEQAFGPQAKADTLQMVQFIRRAMRADIDAASWMSAETKKAAIAKLETVVDRIGYPDTWRDYSGVGITRDDALGNRQQTMKFAHQRTLAKIGQPVDRGEWSMTPPTVNAYYSPDRNTINFPAGFLQPPFYRAGRDAAVNYGAIGAIIGHELTHGFDDQGRKFDAQGNLRDWWTAADSTAYEERARCVADQYSGYTVAGDMKINGRLTLGENTADNGGVRLALMAYLAGPGAKAKDKLDGFTPEQRFFLGFAQKNCGTSRPEAERLQAQTDPHSATRYRVNGPVSNMPEFQKAFACKAGAPMVRPNACRVW